MRLLASLALSPIVCVALAACSASNELDRDDAAELIAAKFNDYPAGEKAFDLTPSGFHDGMEQGYWNKLGELTEKGQRYFASVSAEEVFPKENFPFRIEVSGITDSATVLEAKEADFTLSNSEVDGPGRRFVISGGSGKALLRRYDDGWRLEKILTFEATTDGLKLSKSDEAAALAETEEQNEIQKRYVASSQTPSESVSFQCSPRPYTFNLTITDTNVEFDNNFPGDNRGPLWFGGIDRGGRELAFLHDNLAIYSLAGRKYVLYVDACPDFNAATEKLLKSIRAWQAKYPDLVEGQRL